MWPGRGTYGMVRDREREGSKKEEYERQKDIEAEKERKSMRNKRIQKSKGR